MTSSNHLCKSDESIFTRDSSQYWFSNSWQRDRDRQIHNTHTHTEAETITFYIHVFCWYLKEPVGIKEWCRNNKSLGVFLVFCFWFWWGFFWAKLCFYTACAKKKNTLILHYMLSMFGSSSVHYTNLGQ